MSTTSINFEQIDKTAADTIHGAQNIRHNLSLLEQFHPAITESVTQVLANLADTVEQGKEFTIMHVDSVAAFLAGVNILAHALPNATDVVKKNNTLRALASVAVKGGLITSNAAPIAMLGHKKEDIFKKYLQLVRQYDSSVRAMEPHSDSILPEIKKLQITIDRAITNAQRDEVLDVA